MLIVRNMEDDIDNFKVIMISIQRLSNVLNAYPMPIQADIYAL